MDYQKLLIQWNNRRPLDYWYRKKYNIGFNSLEHRKLSQVDIYLEWLEERLYKETEDRIKDERGKEEDFKKGVWLRETSDPVISDEWFDKIDIENISSQIQVDD